MSTLRRGQSHVWTLPVGPVDDPGFDQLRSLLSAQEISRCERLTDEANRREYQAAHILARLMLSHFSDVKPADWHFIAGRHGRPEPSPEINSTSLRFNISHATGMVACALCLKDDIGVDIEWTERPNRLAEIAKHKFAAAEVACLEAAPKEDRRGLFFSIWTLKESYIKAIGKGLVEPLDGFAFSLEPLAISFLNGAGDPDCWRFKLFQPSPVHLAALSVARPAGARLDITRRHLSWADLVQEAAR